MTAITEPTPRSFTPIGGGLVLLLLLFGGAGGLVGCVAESATTSIEVLPPQGTPFGASVPQLAEADPLEPGPGVGGHPGLGESAETLDPRPEAEGSSVESGSDSPQSPEPSESREDGVREVSFAQLASFEYEPVDPLAILTREKGEAKDEIPEAILSLDGEMVEIDGYLMPTIFESGRVEKFLLTRSYITCCFGDVLNMNEVVDVTVGPKLEVSYFLSGQPVTVTGWLEVGEKTSEFGYVESIYRLIAEKVEERW